MPSSGAATCRAFRSADAISGGVERSKLEEYIQEAYRRTAESLERSQRDDDADDDPSDGP